VSHLHLLLKAQTQRERTNYGGIILRIRSIWGMIYFTLPPFVAPIENIFLKCASYPIKDFKNSEKGKFLENAACLLTD